MVKKKPEEVGKVDVASDFKASDITIATLNSIVDSSGLEAQQIYDMYYESYNTLKGKVKSNIEKLSINGVRNAVRKLLKKSDFVPKAKAVGIVGFIIGDGGLWDKIQVMRNKAKYYVEKNGLQAAVDANLINMENQVLDQREKIFGKENPKYLEPLNDKTRDSSRTLYLIARINGSKEYKFGTIQTNEHSLGVGWGKVKFFKPCQTFGIVKENAEAVNYFKLNSSQAEDTLSVFKAVNEDINVEQVLLNTLKKELTAVSGVEKEYELTKDAWDRVIFVKGVVAWINRDRPSPFGTISMGLMDEETDDLVVVDIPEHVAADFGEQSIVVVIGKTLRGDLRDEDEEGKVKYIKGEGNVKISAYGIYPLEGLTTPKDINKPEALADEQEIIGWVE